jgi:hypothetical protein
MLGSMRESELLATPPALPAADADRFFPQPAGPRSPIGLVIRK